MNNRVELSVFAENEYLRYGVMTLLSRALPRVQDGMGPVHRRLLFAMDGLGLRNSAKPVKSARVVGETLGLYHPHGDSSVYEAMVRMAQAFSLRYPLVTGQGNFGTADGDSAASMRYTEARLSQFAELLLSDELKHAIEYKPNYDNTREEPTLLPARLPVLWLNGAEGVAVGMRTSIPSHNLREIAACAELALANPGATTADYLKLLRGPDYPTGGVLLAADSHLHDLYETGSGSLRVSGTWETEDLKRGQWQLIIKSLPPSGNATRFCTDIAILANPPIPKGKKSNTPLQLLKRQNLISLIETVRNESSSEAGLRLVVVPKTSKVSQADLVAFLCAETCLATTESYAFNVVDDQGAPRTVSLRESLQMWANFRLETVRNQTEYLLDVNLKRQHLLAGRELVLLRIEEVIRCIRESDTPKASLIAQFGLTEAQADDILEMRLRQLSRLDFIALQREQKALSTEAARLTQLLRSDKALRKHVIADIQDIAARLGDDRRTTVSDPSSQPHARTSMGTKTPILAGDPVSISLENGMLKAKAAPSSKDSAESDGCCVEVLVTSNFGVLDASGRIYSVDASAVPLRGNGTPASALCNLGTAAVGMVTTTCHAVFVTKAGMAGCLLPESLVTRQRAGKSLVGLKDQDQVLLIADCTPASDWLLLETSLGRKAYLPAKELPQIKSGRGAMALKLKDTEHVVRAVAMASEPAREAQAYRIARGGSPKKPRTPK